MHNQKQQVITSTTKNWQESNELVMKAASLYILYFITDEMFYNYYTFIY